MITFVEKTPYELYDRFNNTSCFMYPTYMVKGGKEFFMFNRREPDSALVIEANEARKQRLIANNGAYFMFNGYYADPLEMLSHICERKHHFADPENLYCSFEKNGFIDFLGNRREVSAAFHYRVYDVSIGNKIQKVASLIGKERWDDALEEIKAE